MCRHGCLVRKNNEGYGEEIEEKYELIRFRQ